MRPSGCEVGRLLLLGASVRALAESALRSPRARERFPDGLLLLDYFADDDLQREPRVRFVENLEPRSTAGLGRAVFTLAAGGAGWSGLAFTGGLENRPGLLRLLARRAPILGNSPAVVAAVRDPERLARFLDTEGVFHAGVSRLDTAPATGAWLFKRLRGAGGSGVRLAPPGERRRPGEYLQARLDGIAGSVAFVADGNEARLLGASVEIGSSEAGRAALATLAAPPFRYAGNIAGPVDDLFPAAALRTLRRAATRIAARFELRGLNGIDCVLTDRGPVVLEVNPRYTASMEILEERDRPSFFDAHLRALAGSLPPDSGAAGWRAKAILYSDAKVQSPEPEALVPLGARDRPHRGQTFDAGRPLCTLVVAGTGADDCRRRLAERAAAARRLFPTIASA